MSYGDRRCRTRSYLPEISDNAEAFVLLRNLGLALVAGFLIGFEREWTQELEKQQHTFAGARTFALVGFVGGLVGVLSDGALLVAITLAVIGALTIAAYRIRAQEAPGRGGTTEIAILAAFLLGFAAGRDLPLIASAGSVAVAIVLSMKNAVESWARALDRHEIHATLRFLAITLLVLPLLPDRDYGPYGTLNPRELWFMVVLISGLSFLGYGLVRIFGDDKGVLAAGIVGGLASSTATTLSLSKFARDGSAPPATTAAGIVMANVVMLIRVAVILAAVSRPTVRAIAPALAAGAIVGSLIALVYWRRAPRDSQGAGAVSLGNPFELRPALVFAGILALVSMASAFGADRFGAAGIYVIGLISGLADVDAMTLSAGRQAASGALGAEIAAGAILIAVLSNIVVKGIMSLTIGGRTNGLYVLAAFALIAGAGAAAFVLV